MSPSGLHAVDGEALSELAPLLRRATALDAGALARFRTDVEVGSVTAFVRLPFAVLAARSVTAQVPVVVDVTVSAAETLTMLDGPGGAHGAPAVRDAQWRGGVPPARGWRRLDTVPDDTLRGLVRSGALALKDAAAREGVPGAQPRAEVADALLDSVVLSVDDGAATRGEVTLRLVSALTRMGFLLRGGHAHVDVGGRWIRVVGGYGTVYAERPGSALSLT